MSDHRQNVVDLLREWADQIEAGDVYLREASYRPVTKEITHPSEVKVENRIVGKRLEVVVGVNRTDKAAEGSE